ncbi:MAG: HigA family addiction module antitoxin [Isosphaerales bacterium]
MATKNRPVVAAVFPPGDFIREELEARGWTQSDLAEVLGRPFQTVNAIVNGRKAVTPRMARELEAAFGASAEFWMNLEISYQLHRESVADPRISVRAKARDKSRLRALHHPVEGKGLH